MSVKNNIVASIRTQVQLKANISSTTNIIKVTDTDIKHTNYGAATLVDTNSGAEYGLVVHKDATAIVFYNKSTIPSGWYAITYTWISS